MIEKEEKLTLSQVSKKIPGRPNTSTLWRHATKGYKVKSGVRVYLEYVRYGRRIFTSIEAVDRFASEVAKASRESFDQPDNDLRQSWGDRKKKHGKDDLEELDDWLDDEGF